MADEKDLAQEKMLAEGPKSGEKYLHFKGGEYEVVACAIKEDTLEPLVIYRSLLKGTIWARTFSNWNEEVELNGQRVKRFTKIG